MPHLSDTQRDLGGPYGAAGAVDLSTTDAAWTAPTTPSGIYVGGTGDVKVDMQGGGTVTFKAVPAGALLRICVTKIYKTGTTATLLVALHQSPI